MLEYVGIMPPLTPPPELFIRFDPLLVLVPPAIQEFLLKLLEVVPLVELVALYYEESFLCPKVLL